MTLPDLKQLDKIIQLCRKRGVKTIKIDNIELTLGEEIPKTSLSKANTVNPAAPEFSSDGLTEEELLFWSTGVPIQVNEAVREQE